MDKTKDLSAVERGMVVGARHTGLCQELQRCWVFYTEQFPVRVQVSIMKVLLTSVYSGNSIYTRCITVTPETRCGCLTYS